MRRRGRDRVAADVSERTQIEGVVGDVRSHWGGIDILVANAGAYLRRPVLELTVTEIEDSMAVNFTARQLRFSPRCRRWSSAAAAILSSSNSIDGRKALPGDGPYAVRRNSRWPASAQVLRQELRQHGIGVTSVFPGRVDTAMTAKPRRPPDLVEAASRDDRRGDRQRDPPRSGDVIVPRRAAGLLLADLLSPRFADWVVERLRLNGSETG